MQEGPETAAEGQRGEKEEGVEPREAIRTLDSPTEGPEKKQDTHEESDHEDAQGNQLDTAQLVGFQLFAVDRNIRSCDQFVCHARNQLGAPPVGFSCATETGSAG